MSRILIVIVALAVVIFGAYQLLPERYAVNAPFRQLIAGVDNSPGRSVVQRMRVPPGFHVSVWARNLPGARMLALTPAGNILVSQPHRGKVVEVGVGESGESLPPRDLLTGLDRPHGLAVTDKWLYIAEASDIARVAVKSGADGALELSGPVQRIVTGLPEGGNHWSRSVKPGPDGRLYITVGSSCNVCKEEDARRATMLVANADGSDLKIYATGLRNAVGFDWRPGTQELYATDNGRDLLGDNFPPCELNRIVEGGFYGWPYANGDNVPDPDFGAGHEKEIANAIAPAFSFRAHNAPLGITFIKGKYAPEGYRGTALVALHGSWNRSEKDGYKVVSLHWKADGGIESRDFLTGFEVDGDVIGRPVDVVEGRRGEIYISDDYGGVIWRVTFSR